MLTSFKIWYEKNKTVFWAAYAVTVIAYSYLFTEIRFDNHTLPQVWTFSYPSYRTLTEGRWFSDFLLWFIGGAGVQSTQMYVSVGIYMIDAIIVAGMFGAEGGIATFLAAVFLNVYPANLDRYSFPGSQITFVAADTFAVLAVLALSRHKDGLKALLMATPLFMLCLATYPPAIALAAFLVLAHCVSVVLHGEDEAGPAPNGLPLKRMAVAAAAFTLGSALYLASTRIIFFLNATQNPAGGHRTHVNSLYEALSQITGAYPAFARYFTMGADYIPTSLVWLPLAAILVGGVSLVAAAWRRSFASVIAVLLLVLLMPVALRLSYVIDSQAYEGAGRIVYPYGFAFMFFLMAMRNIKALKAPSNVLALVLVFFMVVIAAQETNKAYMRMIFDTGKINRIAARIEGVVPDLYAAKRALVVIGQLNMNDKDHRYVSYPNKGNLAHINMDTFAIYRQPDILNFYFGSEIFSFPTVQQEESAIASSKGRRSWPAPDSVYMNDDTLVVLLEEWRPGVSVTRTR